MNKMYAIRNNAANYQELDLQIYDVIASKPANINEDTVLDFSETNYAMVDWWTTLDTEFNPIDNPSEPIPDISKWIDATLVLSPRAHRLLGETLKEFGELLPITVKGEIFYIFNCLTYGKIKEELCKKSYYEGEEFGIKTIVFDETDVQEKLIFKTAYNSCFELYCGDRFKNAVETFGLTGSIFSEKLVEDFNS